MNAGRDIFAPDYAETPYWWRAAPPRTAETELPELAEIAIVGAGITGLSAALELARAGRDVVVIDAEGVGYGASSRNGGFVGKTLKHSLGEIVHSLGEDAGVAFYREAEKAYRGVFELVERERLDCHLTRGGRLVLSYSQKQQSDLIAELEMKRRLLGETYQPLDATGVAEELQTSIFVGGARIEDSATIHPGLYVQGLFDAARRAGARVASHTRLLELGGEAGGFALTTSRGSLRARNVLIATNGYGSDGVPRWLQRRVVPFEGFVLATEELPAALMDALLPRDRSIVDGRINLAFIRRAPDTRRIVFGARAGMKHGRNLETVAAAIWRDALKILPALEGHRIEHCWSGFCAGTFDMYPHSGERDGIHYAMGYNFGGIAMGSYLGRLVAQRLMGVGSTTPFVGRPFPTAPFYTGEPWFLPMALKYFEFQDRRAIGRRPL